MVGFTTGLCIFLTLFLIIWMALTFSNQFCTGALGFDLCFANTQGAACVNKVTFNNTVCQQNMDYLRAQNNAANTPAIRITTPAPAPSALTAGSGTSGYIPEPYSK